MEYLIGAIMIAVSGIIAWAFSISNRMTKAETLIETYIKEINRRLGRIEKKLWNGDSDNEAE